MRVSSARITSKHIVHLLFLLFWALGLAPAGTALPRPQAAANGANQHSGNPAEIFQRGQEALKNGNLDQAEQDFREVLELDPASGAAYANLGVVHMRRRQWDKALEDLHQAEKLMPQVSGIRLNIGLAYYRQNEFLKATTPFETVVRDQPDAVQPRYLLGLCYFFADRWADAVQTLRPLWPQESGHFPYLYVLSNAAHRAGFDELDRQASEQLTKIGDGSAQYHLFAGKYYLNRGEYEPAMTEFGAAAKEDQNLPFV
jgi:tetratricopeptide (TPR) repeat protein